MIAHAEERRDIVQDIYLKAFKSLTGFRFQSKLSTWIAQISYNTCLNHIEKKKPQLIDDFNYGYNGEKETPDFAHHHSSLVSPSIVEAVISQKQLSKILTSELENLPPVYKTLICLYHQEEMRYEEISKITALPIGTVKSYLFRARKLLKENILSKYKREEL